MVDVVLQGEWVLHCINWNKGNESLPLLAFQGDVINAISLEYSKKGKLSPSHLEIWNIPSDVCYDNTRLLDAIWAQACSEPLQATNMECFCANINWTHKNTWKHLKTQDI